MNDGYVKKAEVLAAARKSAVGIMLIQRYNLDGFINGLPDASVRPEINAEWNIQFQHSNYDDWYDCTCGYCHTKFKHFDPSKYCPNCGATMHWDGELE